MPAVLSSLSVIPLQIKPSVFGLIFNTPWKGVICDMDGYARDIKLFSGTANPTLAASIARHLEMELGHVNVERFPDGEIFVQYIDNLRTADVFLIQPTCNPTNENIMES